MSRVQIERCSIRIRDPIARDRFVRMMRCADDLMFDAAQMRLEAWADYRRETGEPKRQKTGQYA
jgi:hypothetical protein